MTFVLRDLQNGSSGNSQRPATQGSREWIKWRGEPDKGDRDAAIVCRISVESEEAMNAPSSTKNNKKERDPEMSQTKKGNQSYFGMKMHAGLDEKSGIIHTLTHTTARDSDISQLDKLLHGKEDTVRGDRAYCCKKRKTIFAKRGIRYLTPKKKPQGRDLTEQEKKRNCALSSKRAIGEHAFMVIKCIFRYRKVRYKGLFKNACQQFTLAFLANIYRMRNSLLPSLA